MSKNNKKNKIEIINILKTNIYLLIAIFFILSYITLNRSFFNYKNYKNHNTNPNSLSIPIEIKVKTPTIGSIEIITLKNIKATYYTNTIEETDNYPDIGASGRLIYEGAIALSRDLIKKYNLKWGDIIWVEKMNKYYILEDTMNEKHHNAIDIFTFNRTILNKSFNTEIIIYKYRKEK